MNHEDIRVVAILGPDQAANETIVKETGVEFVADTVEDLFDRVDAVMITCRRGSEHMAYALPFVERGVPLFIDKPFTSDPEEADTLMAKIRQHGCPVMGGSACKYLPGVREIKDLAAKLREENKFMGASMSFQIKLDSIYDGIYFYASHLVEMCLEAFGFDVKGVQAMRTGPNLLVNVQYENDAVSLQFVKAGKPSCLVYGWDKNYHFDIDTASLHTSEATAFAELLHGTHDSLTAEQLVKPVHMIAAIQKAMLSGEHISM